MRIWIQYDIDSAAVVVAVTVAAASSETADQEDEASLELGQSYGLGVAGRMKHHLGFHDADDSDCAADHRTTIPNSDSMSDHHFPSSSFHHDSFDSRLEEIQALY